MGDDPPRGRRAGTLLVTVTRDARLPRVTPGVARIRALVGAVLRHERVRHALVQVNLVTAGRIAKIHRARVGVAGVTDIVTLQHDVQAPGAPVAGEFWIAPDVARGHARERGIPVREEVARLVIHGVLHTLGWTHPADDSVERSAMWRRQEAHLARARRAGVV